METTKTIKAGKTYQTRSTCDHECIYSAEVISRTAKRATIKIGMSDLKTVGISVYEGVEQFFPFGKYSMAPIMTAEDAQ